MKHRIVVLGAGYAGATAAGRLARRLDPAGVEITLVNADPWFVERVRLHQLATGQAIEPRALDELVAGTGVRVRVARVTAVDPARRTVAVAEAAGEAELGYETLVYALGSAAADLGVPGVAEHAFDVAGLRSASRLRDRLADLPAGAAVLVVGGGLTSIEAATEIADARPDLSVALAARGGLGDWLGEKARRHLRAGVDRLGVAVHEHTEVVRVDPDGAATADGGRIPAAVTVWATGFTVDPIARASGLEVDPAGRIVVDDSLRSVSHPDVYAVGDAAHAPGAGGRTLRMSCASGVPAAQHAADAIAARLTGRPVPPNTVGYTAQCISLGRHDAVVQWVTRDDRPKPSALTGRSAVRVKELICKVAAWTVAHPTAMVPARRRRVVAGGPQPVRDDACEAPRRG